MGLYAIWRSTGDSLKWCVSSEFRAVRQLQKSDHANLHQVSNFTQMDRYPVVFNACRMYYIKQPTLKILSFGCSTGQEVLTLRQYFPEAKIVGVDINSWNIKTCLRRYSDERMSFYHSDDPAWQIDNHYDAIFCMAVLQRTENRTLNLQVSSQIYPFVRFDNQLNQLDGYLKQGGVMALDETDYRFTDASVAEHYQPLQWDTPVLAKRYLFDCNNQKINTYQRVNRIFVKQK